MCLAKEARKDLDFTSEAVQCVHLMKGVGSKNKFTANNARVNSTTSGFLGNLSDSSCNKSSNYQTSPCKQFYKIQGEVLCKLPWHLLALWPTSVSTEVQVFETILSKIPGTFWYLPGRPGLSGRLYYKGDWRTL